MAAESYVQELFAEQTRGRDGQQAVQGEAVQHHAS